jgi:hypothetical protein
MSAEKNGPVKKAGQRREQAAYTAGKQTGQAVGKCRSVSHPATDNDKTQTCIQAFPCCFNLSCTMSGNGVCRSN